MLKIYRASAGSGKTFRLTQDYIHLLFNAEYAHAHRRILAVTFTNKATEEMKSRILEELYLLASGQKSNYREGLMKVYRLSEQSVNQKAQHILVNILHDYTAFSISTIDRFFQQIIRSFAREIGVYGGYALELDSDGMLEQAVDNLFLELSEKENAQLLKWLVQFAEERIENAQNWDMRRDILSLGHEIFKEKYQHKAVETNQKLHDKAFLKTISDRADLDYENLY
jgi:ATP-dependent helicase/nuclease subunit A